MADPKHNDEIINAASHMVDDVIRRWVIAGLVFTAREVVKETPGDPLFEVRRTLAVDTLKQPDDMNVVRLTQNILSVDPAFFIHASVLEVGQDVFLQTLAELWTEIACLVYPELVPTSAG